MPYRVSARQRQLVEAIQLYCRVHCPTAKAASCGAHSCPLYPYRIPFTDKADQTHLFMESDQQNFYKAAVDAALHCAVSSADNGVWWHDIRLECDKRKVLPTQSSWWGSICHTKEWKENFICTNISMKNPYPGANGTAEFRWIRRGSAPIKKPVQPAAAKAAPAPDPAWRDD
jgi:hypothetical protein